MRTRLLIVLLLLPLAGLAAPPVIPEPAELEPDVQFWVRVYSEITTNEGYIHDQWNLAIIYQTLHFGAELAPSAREKLVDAAREHYRTILRRLGHGGAPQDEDEQRVRGLWGEAPAARLLQAADDVRFQLGQSDRFRAGLVRAGAWEEHIARTLSAQGLPAEIAVLPHVESSFQPDAMSKAGAAGLWQFIRSTGRRFLRIDRAVDERLDPDRETEAAAQLLALNYQVLGSWPLAITAYNHGAAGMRRAREQVGSDDIVQIVRHYRSPSFGFASRNYYCSFLAVLRLDRDPEKYFGPLVHDKPVETRELTVSEPVRVDTLRHILAIDIARLRELNPALRAAVWNLQQFVPRGYRLRLPAALASWTTELLSARLAGAEPGTAGTTGAIRVASATPTPKAKEASAGGLRGRTVTGAVAKAASNGPSRRGVRSAAEVAAELASYVVRGGDTLAAIAVRTGVDAELLMRANGLRDSDHIYEGERLTLIATSTRATPEPSVLAQAAEEDRQDYAQALAAATAARSQTVVSAGQAQGPALLADAEAPPSADPIDYSVDADSRLTVVAAETIGHYADWLGVSTASLRGLNRMRGRSAVLIGRRFRLEFSRVTREQFEQRRRNYHQRLQSDYFATHHIVGTDTYIARRGDSLWSVTQRSALPVWLLQQYNPDVDFGELRPGTPIVLPRVEDAS
ncbi:MAG TPA: transglycosylase SLT domain-containing protein [Steroidobacteraceae bacterium]